MLIHLLIAVIVIGVLAYLAQWAPVPQPFRWILYAVVVVIALVVLLPFVGLHV